MRLPFHKLSLYLALIVGATAMILAVFVLAAVERPAWWVGIVLGLALGCVTHVAARRLLAPRIELARATLEAIRHHQFDNLKESRLPRGDELADLTRQVYRTGQAVERDLERYKSVENYRRDFLGDVSHELKTPIFSIRGFAETLLSGALDDPHVNRSFVEKILRNADRLGHLTHDLTEISRIESGELKMTMAPFDLRRVIRDVLESLEQIAAEKMVTMRVNVADALPPVIGDANQIRQVLINLAENAVKYNNKGGYVELAARLDSSGEVRISVIDDGIGLAPEHISRLTERFYRVDKSRSRSEGGTGLGLAIVKHILGAHNRTLLIESRANRGSSFGFSLPVMKHHVPSDSE